MKMKATVFVTAMWVMAVAYVVVDSEFLGNQHSIGTIQIQGWSVLVLTSYCLALAFDCIVGKHRQ